MEKKVFPSPYERPCVCKDSVLAAATMADEAEVQKRLQNGNNQFTAKMFTEVVKENPGKSVVMSAFSVLTPIAQLAFAAEGTSHDELLRAIGMPNDNATSEVFGLINKNLRSVKGVDLRMASRVYIPIGYELNENFRGVSRDLFGTEPKNVDFTKSSQTAGEINAWVEDQTNKKIKDLVSPDSLDEATRALLVNAIYFKGKWKSQFKVDQTTDRDFHVNKQKTIKVPTMHQKGDFQYAESQELDAKLLRMDYEGSEASMLIILPNDIEGLPALEEKLKNPDLLSQATQRMYTHEVDVYLPKFKIETETDLKKVLENIGVTKIFGSEAQLTRLLIGTSDLYVSAAKQKAFIEVNEEGAEAAAANVFTGPVAVSAKLPRPASTIFIADRPFYFEVGKIMRHDKGSLFTTIFNGVYGFDNK